MTSATPRLKAAFFLIGILLVALWLRAPFIRSGMPYFYDEDEAHHYNRVVNMVKRGEFNPNYFLKPSLHFYLRMPVVAAGFLASVRAGELRSLKEIVTRDTFGVGDYSFSAFPQRIAKWSRTYSLLWSLALVLLTFVAARTVTGNGAGAVFAALLVALSPPLVSSSATIAVDQIVCVLALATAIQAVRYLDAPSNCRLWSLGLLAGLAIGTKYNAAPIALLPLIAVIASRTADKRAVAAAVLLPCAGFIISTPFLFVNLPLFLDHIAYEIWHYGIEGHVGHTAEPGLPQAFFYLGWLSSNGIGIVAFALAAIGIGLFARSRDRAAAVFLAFPLLYFLFMISQKANFTRNMHVVIPFLAVAFSASILAAGRKFKGANGYAPAVVGLLALIQPLLGSFGERRAASSIEESRITAAAWLSERSLSEHGAEAKRTAVSGSLQFEPSVFMVAGVERVDPSKVTVKALAAQGFDRLVTGPKDLIGPEELTLLTPVSTIRGDTSAQRVVRNPEIVIYQIKR